MSALSVKSQPLFNHDYYTSMLTSNKSPCLGGKEGVISWKAKKPEDNDKDLSSLSKRLAAISKKLQDKQSHEYATLKQEIGKFGRHGVDYLTVNLLRIRLRMDEAVPYKGLLKLIEKVINFFANLFGCKEVNFSPAKHTLLIEAKALEIHHELMKEKSAEAEHSIEILGNNRPENLSTENLKALELGFRPSIEFCAGSNRFLLYYEKNAKRFSLQLSQSSEEISLSTLREQNSLKKEQIFKADVADKTDRKDHYLIYSTLYAPRENGGCVCDAGKYSQNLLLKPGHEYEIACRNGEPVRFKIVQKAKDDLKQASA